MLAALRQPLVNMRSSRVLQLVAALEVGVLVFGALQNDLYVVSARISMHTLAILCRLLSVHPYGSFLI